MVQCDVCKVWVHFACTQLNETTASELEIYMCRQCALVSNIISINRNFNLFSLFILILIQKNIPIISNIHNIKNINNTISTSTLPQTSLSNSDNNNIQEDTLTTQEESKIEADKLYSQVKMLLEGAKVYLFYNNLFNLF